MVPGMSSFARSRTARLPGADRSGTTGRLVVMRGGRGTVRWWPARVVARCGHAAGRRVLGRWPARSGVGHGQGAVRSLATRAGFGPARNKHEWPPGLARRGTRTGEVPQDSPACRHQPPGPGPHHGVTADSHSGPAVGRVVLVVLLDRRPSPAAAPVAARSTYCVLRSAAEVWRAEGTGGAAERGGRQERAAATGRQRARPAPAGRLDPVKKL